MFNNYGYIKLNNLMSNPHPRVGSKEKPFKPCSFLREILITEETLLEFNQYFISFKMSVFSMKKIV